VLGWRAVIVIMVRFGAMVIRASSQGFRWDAKCGGNRVQHSFRWGSKPVFDLGEVRVGDTGHRRDLTHRQLGQLSLPADDFADEILR
jgi:hypothetical protein